MMKITPTVVIYRSAQSFELHFNYGQRLVSDSES